MTTFLQRRGESLPRNPANYSGSSSPNLAPTWKSTKKRLLDTRRLTHAGGLVVGIIIVVFLFRSMFARPKVKIEIAGEINPNTNFFIDYEGALDCRITSQELYVPPPRTTPKERAKFPYCQTRPQLLQALNGGGRHGFDEPFTPKGCHYKWYSTTEICMILDRFDGIVFVGDDLMKQIYASFNILLRRDLALGGMQQWKMTDKERDMCRCGGQYTKPDCWKFFVANHKDVQNHDDEGDTRSPYACDRVPHFFLPVSSSPASGDVTSQLANLLSENPHSWKPVAIIHSLGLATSFSWITATESMDEWLTIADGSGRNTPYLWVGPNAAGHLKPPSLILQEGNNALWHYNVELGKEAAKRAVENLSMYNMTLQASSWDGSRYGQKVEIVQAMMIINWLARLETA